MLDIIPSEGPSRLSGRENRKPHFAKASRGRPSKNILKVAWKLPARLRKPIRQQLAAQRQVKRVKRSEGFQRRPLTTQRLVDDPSLQNSGAEYHTADIYRDSVPSMRLVAPPYLGSVVKGRLHDASTPAVLPVRSRTPVARPAATKIPVKSPEPVVSEYSPPEIYEEEIPLAPEAEAHGVVDPLKGLRVKKPKRKLGLPFSVSFLPKGLMSRETLASLKVPSLKRNLSILLIG